MFLINKTKCKVYLKQVDVFCGTFMGWKHYFENFFCRRKANTRIKTLATLIFVRHALIITLTRYLMNLEHAESCVLFER